MNHKLLVKLALFVAADEKAQRKFRNAVLIRLSSIETMLTEVQGAQLVNFWPPERVSDEQRDKYIKEVEERVAIASGQLGLRMIRYIYGESEPPAERHDKRRRWWGWEI